MLGSRVDQAIVDTLEGLIHIQQIHVDPAKRRAIVRERPIADRGPGNRRKPPVKDRKLQGQCGQHGQLILGKVIHDLLRMPDVFLLIEVALHEPLHIRHAIRARIAAEDLQIDGWKMMVGIGIKLPLKLR